MSPKPHNLKTQQLHSMITDLRHRMDVEDEYFSVIEKRDTEIMLKDKKLAEQNVKLAEQNVKLAEQDVKLAEQKVKLAEQDERLKQQENMLRSSLRLFLQSGMSMEEVATKMGMDAEKLKQLLS